MSRLEILSPHCPVDILPISDSRSGSYHSWPGKSLHEFLSKSPTARPVVDASFTDSRLPDDDIIFPNLPPLRNGHPDVHLRNGIMRASRLAMIHEPDAEAAFFVADLSQVYLQHQRWKRCLPDITPHYAIKCNPDPYILRLLAGLGAGFDCASAGEINQVLDIGGIDPSRIIFANPCKAAFFIRSAARSGVDQMTFDNADELHKIARMHPKAKLVVRILADDSKSICRFGIKFGAPLETVPGLLSKAKELNLDVIGVSFHVGSGCFDPTTYTDALRRARAVFDMGKDVGYHFSLLDVGGGFEDANFETAAAVIRDAIDVYFPDRRNIRMISEPGRFYVSNAFRLAANIIARRAAPVDAPTEFLVKEDQPTVMYYINDGVYGAFNCILFDHQTVNPYVLSLNGSFHVSASEPVAVSSVWGPTCDSMDCILKSVALPGALQTGDWLGFDNMGAYTICAASQFNGFEISNVIYTTGEVGAEVRQALAAFAAKGYGL
ncbi:hypothetical protein FIBSPDRAFT_963085 [Athelia psychrophila]|uniref:ornithine decarboxylase n=1 Tax=Athelia psychrophila TaxID=1759441 RepID=A0A165ZDS0_9AGAM|nr:hypothetical protein FIBSPDRAFT_963085 [Fibularhizoctonia sp. CBS 109695]